MGSVFRVQLHEIGLVVIIGSEITHSIQNWNDRGIVQSEYISVAFACQIRLVRIRRSWQIITPCAAGNISRCASLRELNGIGRIVLIPAEIRGKLKVFEVFRKPKNHRIARTIEPGVKGIGHGEVIASCTRR